jgi:outer membrane lipase/esterase
VNISNPHPHFAMVKRAVAILAFCLAVPLPLHAAPFDQFMAFGDSDLDSGWFAGALNGQCGAVTAPCTTGSTNLDTLISSAIAKGGTGTAAGVGLMNSQILAADFGLTAIPANQPGGTNYAIGGSKDAVSGGLGSIHPNPNLPSTVGQIATYLNQTADVANSKALYVIASGGNDITYANDTFTTLTAKETYLAGQAATLAGAIKTLQTDGAKNIVVYGLPGSGTLDTYYTSTLWSDLNTDGVDYLQAAIAAMVAEVNADPTAYGFTATTVLPGVIGSGTTSACISDSGTGWGQYCANTTTPSSDYAYLRASDSEQTSFYSDDQHFSAAGQAIEANFVFNLIENSDLVTPLPASFPLLASGLCMLGLFGWSRRTSPPALSL